MDKKYQTRGIRNKNPFNIKRSINSWQGKLKVSSDSKFEQFCSMDYGIRAGIQLLLNGYIRKGYDTIEKIIPRYAPGSENRVDKYISFILENPCLVLDEKISVNSLDFFWLCQKIVKYESDYDLTYPEFDRIRKKFHLF